MYAQSGILKVEKEHFKLKTQCHVNSNEEGDRFVGIKAESDKAMVYFPIGYELPDSDAEIRRDIKHLMQVLAEFTTKEERLLAVNKFTAAQKVEFPINAYRSVIEYFLSTGKYYVETEATYVTATSGKQEWQRTIKKHLPFVQKKHNMHSLVYSSFVVRTSTPNFDKQITQINKYCVFEAFQKIGWIYSTFMPEKPGTCPSITEAIVVVREKLSGTNDDKKRKLFKSMLDMLNYLDEKTSELQFYFGTEDFDHVWEKLIDKAFGERNKDKYFPRSRWHLDYGKYKEKRPLMPDTIMIYNGKYYVLDAKCYKYGWTGIPDHLPNGSSINKQITYGEYLEKHKGINADSVFNAFIMPFNRNDNCFGISGIVGNIGEATGDWRKNKKPYEHIQGIVMDTRYLMYHYYGKPQKEKIALAECIELVLNRMENHDENDPAFSYMTVEGENDSIGMVAMNSAAYSTGEESV